MHAQITAGAALHLRIGALADRQCRTCLAPSKHHGSPLSPHASHSYEQQPSLCHYRWFRTGNSRAYRPDLGRAPWP
jgi:hypothetical protein